VATLTADTSLPKGIDGSLGLDSLDFIEVSLGIEERFGVVMDEREDLAPHFQSLGTLARYIESRLNGG
jgi:acyl carrier protein